MFVKFCRVKKACTGDGGELERALDDVLNKYENNNFLVRIQNTETVDFDIIC